MALLFLGQTLPPHIKINIAFVSNVTISISNGEIQVSYKLSVQSGKIEISATIDRGEIDIPSLAILLGEESRRLLDLVGYLRGAYIDLFIHTAIDAEGVRTRFDVYTPALSDLRPAQFDIPLEMVDVAGGDFAAGQALADLREAMKVPVATGFFCYRAIEAMMQSMKIAPSEKDLTGWERFRTNLGVDRALIDIVHEQSKPPRHGKPMDLKATKRVEIFKITDGIIYRYFKFVAGGRQPLPVEQFPVLGSLGDLKAPNLAASNWAR